ncbi:hypothetical protein S7711_06141 [Stachybotrys chartarum IBT 7711]|uniref:Peptidase M43 pregnancy-associated plasma-A domain-containing protein n=1 Tax=Stachybotrys chartarum (strain CBS 109288 / IBT 7711) TaxID=1280523 RepID=A0A084B690_STACB|nr:hypothetical protein S7711_06141 [Stachybotrys chartarum IBT 7711]
MIFGLVLLCLGVTVVAIDPEAPLGRGCLVSEQVVAQDTASSLMVGEASNSRNLPDNFTVWVNFHIVSTEELEFLVTPEIIDAQWRVLQESLALQDIHLVLNSTERIVDNLAGNYFLINEGPDVGWVFYEEEQTEFLTTTRKGGYDALNIYFFSPFSPGATGYCQFPTTVTEGDLAFGLDSCRLSAFTMPGVTVEQGGFEYYNLGHLAVHEAGHWFGLNHTFTGSCSESGDFVADTPAQRSEIYGCPIESDSCPDSPGMDPIHNFMGYADDDW